MTNPQNTLSFEIPGIPPRKTLQSGRGAFRDASGNVRFFTRADVRAEAWEMRAEFTKRLPQGWVADERPCKVRVELVYPLRKGERERLVKAGRAEMLVPHVDRPDADNLVKSLLDQATKAGVWVDDAQVWDLRVRKWRGVVPRWAVYVEFGEMPVIPMAKKRSKGGEETWELFQAE